MSQAEYNKRLASLRFDVIQGTITRAWYIDTYPVSTGDRIHISGSKAKIDAVCAFLNAMPLIELAAWLSAKDVRFKAWLETGNFSYPQN